MATSASTIKTAYPLPVYNYRVLIGDRPVSFSEVSGLERSYETITYKESRVDGPVSGPNTMYMPGMLKPLYITLKKGYVKGNSINYLYNWINSINLNQVDKKDISIQLCDEGGTAVITWLVKEAFPIRLSAPGFDASANEIAIDTLELMADTVLITESA
jgi:phage tail-like protein